MNRFKNILVGLDFEDDRSALTAGSRAAVRQAFWLAERTDARVEFIHSTYSDPEDNYSAEGDPIAVAQAEVAGLRKEAGLSEASFELLLSEERPWMAMTRKVLAGADYVVIVAKRNHSKRDDRRLGSVSLNLVRKCPAPVWVVKPEHELGHHCVVAATDLSPVGDLAVELGAFIARADECEFCVVHAWRMPLALQMDAARVGELETEQGKKKIADAARSHIRELPAVVELGDHAQVFLACDSPSHVILQLADKKQPDLVVMGTISRGGIAGMLVGNTAEKLLYRLDCSILTVKPTDFVSPLAG